jgi:hypothetical protein
MEPYQHDVRQEHRLGIYFWNCSGIKSFGNMDEENKRAMLENEIICLGETWVSGNLDMYTIPGYTKFQIDATNFNTGGRLSGGIIVFTKTSATIAEIVERHENWIFLIIEALGARILIGYVYIQPEKDKDILLKELTDKLRFIEVGYKFDSKIIVGDFNARTGNFGTLEEIGCETNEFMTDQRESMDMVVNRRGVKLLDFCRENSLAIVNGRAHSDQRGEVTFINHMGTSCIDLALISTDLCMRQPLDLEVLEESTNHLPVCLRLGKKPQLTEREVKARLRWNNNNRREYTESTGHIQTSTSPASYGEIVTNIFKGAADSSMLSRGKVRNDNYKPWFDKDCRKAKNNLGRLLRECKRQCWGQEIRTEYLESKKEYTRIRKSKSKAYWEGKKLALRQVDSARSFWNAVKTFDRRPSNRMNVSEADWINFYNNQLPPRAQDTFRTPTLANVCELLEAEITMGELDAVLCKLKNGKAPGPDGISNEFIKHLGQNSKQDMLTLFNDCLTEERVPLEWAESTTALIYKKGDDAEPKNYRPIALANTMLKCFTQILAKRITQWAESNNKLPEAQAGFRKGRSCQDHIFTLNGLIQIGLHKPRAKVYGLFIDFERAFPSISFQKLWSKLHDLGLSDKIINTQISIQQCKHET